MKKEKRGQLYILTAVLLCAAVFGIVAIMTHAQKPSDTKELFENYKYEAAQSLNYALYNSQDIFSTFDDFNTEFESYAQAKGVSFNVFYALSDGITIRAYNNLGEDITINSYSLPQSQTINLSHTSPVIVNAFGYDYNLTMPVNDYRAIIKSERGEDITIFVK